jgi:hypothetical protein
MSKPVASLLLSLLLAACAAYSGRGLVPGRSTLGDVLRIMGPPAMEWNDADGSRQLAYVRGPMGTQTFMVRSRPDGTLDSIGNVLEPGVFRQVTAGLDENQVLRLLGPPAPGWTTYFPGRDELAWQWRYCDEWNALARFTVLLDAGRKTVRSTMSQREDQIGECGHDGSCWCGH